MKHQIGQPYAGKMGLGRYIEAGHADVEVGLSTCIKDSSWIKIVVGLSVLVGVELTNHGERQVAWGGAVRVPSQTHNDPPRIRLSLPLSPELLFF